MRIITTKLVAGLVATLFVATACSGNPKPTAPTPAPGASASSAKGMPTSAPATSPSTPAGPGGTAGTIRPKPRPTATAPRPSCGSLTSGWPHSAPAFDPHGPTPDQLKLTDVLVNPGRPKPVCLDLVSFIVEGGHVAYGKAEYVTSDQIVSDAQGERLTQVHGVAVLRIAVKAPLHLGDGDAPAAGTPVVPRSELVGSNIVGVWYGGGQHNQSLFYIGVNAKRTLQAGLEVGPKSSIVNVQFAK